MKKKKNALSTKDKTAKINKVIQTKLRQEKMNVCTSIQASNWLEAEGLLPQDKTRPGRPLRVLLRKGLIKGANKEGSRGNWVIRQVKL